MFLKRLILLFLTGSFFLFLYTVPVAQAQVEDTVAFYLAQGHRYFFMGELEKALEQYRLALDKDPDNLQACLNSAVIYRNLGLYNEVIPLYELASRLSPDNFTILTRLGWAYYSLGFFERSEEIFQKVLSLDPSLSDAGFGLGKIYFEQEKWTKAEQVFNDLIELDPNNASAYFYLGQIYEKQDILDKAASMYAGTLKADYNYTEAQLPIARVYEKKELYEKALDQYNRIINIDPENRQVRDAYKKLKAATLPASDAHVKPSTATAESPQSIIKARHIVSVANPDTVPIVRIGIGGQMNGETVKKEHILFECGGPFRITGKKSNNIIIRSEGSEPWVIKSESSGELIISSWDKKKTVSVSEPVIISLEEPKNTSIAIKSINYGNGFSWAGEENRQYRGDIEVTLNLNIINIIRIEEYLYSVLPSEMYSSWPMEALKAQAVVARSEALYKQQYVRSHAKYGYDLCDSQHCQMYRGVMFETERTRQAVDATRSEILEYNGEIAHAFYSSNCGGHTQSSEEIGWGSIPYLEGVLDAEDEIEKPVSPYSLEEWIRGRPDIFCDMKDLGPYAEFRWMRVKKRSDLQQWINNSHDIGTLMRIIPLKRSTSGHIQELKIKGSKGEMLISGELKIRRALGAGYMRSSLFAIETIYRGYLNNDTSGECIDDMLPEEFIFYGGGWGHAVGMCQTGAAGMAQKGYTYKEILQHFFKDVTLERLEY